MSSSSSELMQQVDRAIKKDSYPNWVHCFLERRFFYKCQHHDDDDNNDLNRYCITCDVSTCKSCVTLDRHKDHDILTIYRHVYKNVVPLSQMETHMDCGEIQSYKCNKMWVLSLTPLPHKGSGLLIKGIGACHVCKRKLNNPDRFCFCSIECKVQSNTDRNSICFPISGKTEEFEQSKRNEKTCKRSRKGVPRRGV